LDNSGAALRRPIEGHAAIWRKHRAIMTIFKAINPSLDGLVLLLRNHFRESSLLRCLLFALPGLVKFYRTLVGAGRRNEFVTVYWGCRSLDILPESIANTAVVDARIGYARALTVLSFNAPLVGVPD
jgi:hypothetical protein